MLQQVGLHLEPSKEVVEQENILTLAFGAATLEALILTLPFKSPRPRKTAL